MKGPATLKTLQVTEIAKGSRFVNHLSQKTDVTCLGAIDQVCDEDGWQLARIPFGSS